MLQFRYLTQLFAERLGVALALLAERLHQFFLLDELLAQRQQRRVDRLVSSLELLRGKFLLALELLLRLLHQRLRSRLQHIRARGLEHIFQRLLGASKNLPLLIEILLPLGKLRAQAAEFLLGLRPTRRFIVGPRALSGRAVAKLDRRLLHRRQRCLCGRLALQRRRRLPAQRVALALENIKLAAHRFGRSRANRPTRTRKQLRNDKRASAAKDQARSDSHQD